MDLSVVIAARNVAETLGEQLDALLAQDWDGAWEIVVVDNGSTDSTAALVEEYSRRSARVRLVRAHERSGPSYARNVGFAAATAENIASCDADDVVGEGWVRAMGDALREHACVTGPLDVEQLNSVRLSESRGRLATTGPTWFGVFPIVAAGNLGIQRAAFNAVGGFDEAFRANEDHDLALRLVLAGVDVHFEPAAVVHYRYRQSPSALWHQGLTYGTARPLMWRRVRDSGLPPPSRVAGWRSWAWLVVHLGALRTPEGRASWVWVAGNRLGQVRGSFRHRTVFL
ncbi:MAG: glycosyltransferase [Acidimicrobiia bacterium]